MESWTQKFDELIEAYAYEKALALLDEVPAGPEQESSRRLAQSLRAVQLFSETKFNQATNLFLELETTPALVLALYPEEISGRLSVHQKDWIRLFGGKGSLFPEEEEEKEKDPDSASLSSVNTTKKEAKKSMWLVGGLEGFMGGSRTRTESAQSDASSVKAAPPSAKTTPRKGPDDHRRSLEALLRYLPDRRQKVIGAFAKHADVMAKLAWTSLFSDPVSDLQTIPSVPIEQLEPTQLLRVAQIVDGALLKSYLAVRPGLVGSLCRLDPNWCEVSEVETELKARKKYDELIALYRGKKLHESALHLLHELSEEEDDDEEEKVGPTIRYLQRLGVQHLDVIFSSAEWVFKASPTKALEIFTADLSEVDTLPRDEVARYLQRIDPSHDTCIQYLEQITTRGEDSWALHELLVDLYLEKAPTNADAYRKLLNFIQSSDKYRPDRLLARLPQNDLYEARALLLGKLGRHEGALQIYVNRLEDYHKAEQYCKRMQGTHPELFLVLLKLYLAPEPGFKPLIAPALALIAHHSVQLEPIPTLELLPPLMSVQDVSRFLSRALKDERKWARLEREVRKSRGDAVAFELVKLQERKVVVGDLRICPQCKKRLGSSVIAVHSPRGEVTHYQCREAFSRQIMAERGMPPP
ncbi:hypothetical protein CALVIDRAFT_552763 [Calocera viscosa TUFC12733]|uniref:Rab guanyl-nucleotide exchange factor n=1 Tax=Calocera viscosa (strain TUFC12733) TaxID=1330018 RepID=A0A167R2T1_CALVF|nr:hypothetical protein CALVIDRAFT_552763 [Calocera viscosa TUFC12733]